MDDDTLVEVSILYRQFGDGDLCHLDAIKWLQRIGFNSKDADQMVSEWADYYGIMQPNSCGRGCHPHLYSNCPQADCPHKQ